MVYKTLSNEQQLVLLEDMWKEFKSLQEMMKIEDDKVRKWYAKKSTMWIRTLYTLYM